MWAWLKNFFGFFTHVDNLHAAMQDAKLAAAALETPEAQALMPVKARLAIAAVNVAAQAVEEVHAAVQAAKAEAVQAPAPEAPTTPVP